MPYLKEELGQARDFASKDFNVSAQEDKAEFCLVQIWTKQKGVPTLLLLKILMYLVVMWQMLKWLKKKLLNFLEGCWVSFFACEHFAWPKLF